MKKAILARALMGFPMGIAIGQCISLLVSALLGRGTFEACVPSFVTAMGSELSAVALQTLLCGILGAASAASSASAGSAVSSAGIRAWQARRIARRTSSSR